VAIGALGCVGVIGLIGSQIWPVVGSSGVTGGPENASVVGTIGENLINLWQVMVGKATCIGEEQEY